ncbi:MAG: hypothetical protein ACLGIF_03640 [Actinomycetes bacterium]
MSHATIPSIQDLQSRVHRMEGAATSRALPLLPALSGLLELRTGSACSVEGAAVALALLAGPSRAGEWSAVVGVPELGLEAATGFGIDLSRTIVVPDPGEHWLSVTAGLVDVASVVLVRPPTAVSEQQASRIGARLRVKDAALIAWGRWPRAAVRLSAHESTWLGLGRGHGCLRGRRVRVTVTTNSAPPREATLLLTGPQQEVVRLGAEEAAVASPVVRAG